MHPDIIGLICYCRGKDGVREVTSLHKSFTVKNTNVFFNAIHNLRRTTKWILDPPGVYKVFGFIWRFGDLGVGKILHQLHTIFANFLGYDIEVSFD